MLPVSCVSSPRHSSQLIKARLTPHRTSFGLGPLCVIITAIWANKRYYISIDNLQAAMIITAVLVSILFSNSTAMSRIGNLVSGLLIMMLTGLVPILAYLLDTAAHGATPHHPGGGDTHPTPTGTSSFRPTALPTGTHSFLSEL